jgi:IS30 family transposase
MSLTSCDPAADLVLAIAERTVHSALDLEWVATELNDRPRKRLGFAKPIEEIGPLLLR